jgi:hypothetical protein
LSWLSAVKDEDEPSLLQTFSRPNPMAAIQEQILREWGAAAREEDTPHVPIPRLLHPFADGREEEEAAEEVEGEAEAEAEAEAEEVCASVCLPFPVCLPLLLRLPPVHPTYARVQVQEVAGDEEGMDVEAERDVETEATVEEAAVEEEEGGNEATALPAPATEGAGSTHRHPHCGDAGHVERRSSASVGSGERLLVRRVVTDSYATGQHSGRGGGGG